MLSYRRPVGLLSDERVAPAVLAVGVAGLAPVPGAGPVHPINARRAVAQTVKLRAILGRGIGPCRERANNKYLVEADIKQL